MGNHVDNKRILKVLFRMNPNRGKAYKQGLFYLNQGLGFDK